MRDLSIGIYSVDGSSSKSPRYRTEPVTKLALVRIVAREVISLVAGTVTTVERKRPSSALISPH